MRRRRGVVRASGGRWSGPMVDLKAQGIRGLAIGAAVGLATMLLAAPVLAGADAATPPSQVPDHPLPAGCGVTDNGAFVASSPNPNVNFPDTEVEPMIGVDRNSGKNNMVAAFQQDRWTTGGAHGTITAVSHTGGATWTALGVGTPGTPGAVPTFDRCTNGAAFGFDFERSSDPWVTVAPNGDAYQTALVFDVTQPGFGGPSGVGVSKSPASSHGEVWQQPVLLGLDTSTTALNDKESITADPNTSNN